jgi:hypothetical protein
VHSFCKFLFAEYENNLNLIIRLHFYPFYFGLGPAGLARTQPEPVTGWPGKARAGHGLTRKSPSLSRHGPKRPGPRMARAEFGPRVNGPGRLEQKSPHKARVARPEGQHYIFDFYRIRRIR